MPVWGVSTAMGVENALILAGLGLFGWQRFEIHVEGCWDMKSHPESPEIKKYEKLRSWWLWMFCEWFPLQLHFRYRRVRLPSVRDASLTDGLANGANEMEGMLGGPEGRCQTEQGSPPSSQETAGNPMSWEANRERLNAFHYFKTFQYLFCYTVLGILARLTFGLHRLQVRPRRVPELRPVAPVRLVGLVGKCHFADMSSPADEFLIFWLQYEELKVHAWKSPFLYGPCNSRGTTWHRWTLQAAEAAQRGICHM